MDQRRKQARHETSIRPTRAPTSKIPTSEPHHIRIAGYFRREFIFRYFVQLFLFENKFCRNLIYNNEIHNYKNTCMGIHIHDAP